MNSLRRNALANVGGRVFTAALWLAITPFVLAGLGPERFGVWSLLFAFSGYLMSMDLGIGATIMRFTAAHRSSGRRAVLRTLRWGLWLGIGQGLLWALIIVLARGWIAVAFHVPAEMMPEVMNALWIFAGGVVLMFPSWVLIASVQGFERLELSNLCLALGIGAQVVALYVGISAGGGLEVAAIAGVIAYAISGLLAALMLRSLLRDVGPGEPDAGPTWRDLMHFSVALWLLGLLAMAQLQAGRFVLGLLGNLRMVTEYELAFRVANAVAGIPWLMLLAVVPAASRAWEGGGLSAVVPLFRSTSRWAYTYTALSLGALWLLAPDVVRLWLGAGHGSVADLIRIWVVAYAVSIAYAPGAFVARGMGMPWFEVGSYAAALVSNIALAVLWVPVHGTSGAIGAVCASYGVGFIVFVLTFHPRSGIALGPWLREELVPRAIAGLLVVVLGAALLAAGPVAGRLPPPGWVHGAVAGLLFLTLFALCFLPLGDTQRLTRSVMDVISGAFARRPSVRAS